MSLQEYEVRESRAEERALLVPFVYEHGRHELFALYLKARGKEYDDECHRLLVPEAAPVDELPKAPSVVAVHRPSGKICGIVMVTVRESSSRPPPDFSRSVFSEWLQAVIGPALRVDLHEMFPSVRRIAQVRQLLVAEEHRHRGLGGALLQEAVRLAKSKDAELVHGLFTSPHSRRLGERMGFRSVADFDVADARDSNGEPMYPGVGSYVYSKMVKEL